MLLPIIFGPVEPPTLGEALIRVGRFEEAIEYLTYELSSTTERWTMDGYFAWSTAGKLAEACAGTGDLQEASRLITTWYESGGGEAHRATWPRRHGIAGTAVELTDRYPELALMIQGPEVWAGRQAAHAAAITAWEYEQRGRLGY